MTKVLVEIEDGKVIGVYANKDISFVIVDKKSRELVSEIYQSDHNYSQLSDVFNEESDQIIKEQLLKINY